MHEPVTGTFQDFRRTVRSGTSIRNLAVILTSKISFESANYRTGRSDRKGRGYRTPVPFGITSFGFRAGVEDIAQGCDSPFKIPSSGVRFRTIAYGPGVQTYSVWHVSELSHGGEVKHDHLRWCDLFSIVQAGGITRWRGSNSSIPGGVLSSESHGAEIPRMGGMRKCC